MPEKVDPNIVQFYLEIVLLYLIFIITVLAREQISDSTALLLATAVVVFFLLVTRDIFRVVSGI